MRLNKHLPSLLFIVGFTLAVLLTFSQVVQLGYSYRAVAEVASWENIGSYPRRAESFVPFVEERGAVVPDWTQVTFSIFPPVSESGGFSMTPEVLEQLGYDPSLSWSAGQTIDQFLKLGNFQDAGLQLLSLEEIAYSSGLDLGSISLADLEPLQWQTIEDLVLAVPELGELSVGDVQPIFDRLILENPALADLSGTSLSEIIATPKLAGLVLGDIDLSSYKVDAIPFLSSKRLENLRDWQGSFIAGIPGLKEVPWSEFPNPLSGAGFVALFDIAYGEKEAHRLNTITGSDVEGFEVPCNQASCPYIELSGPPWLGATAIHGKQWIVGPAQMVKGGHGVLSVVNGGQEPTGRHPFGPAFKVVLQKTVESEGLGQFAIYFRYCSGFLGCTPYFIGPVPWINQHENDIIFVGLTQDLDPPPPANIPENPGLPPGFELPPGAVVPNNADEVIGSDDCQTYKGVSMGALKQGIAEIESYGGDYTAIGQYVCADKGANCGRALGKYQFMPYNEHAERRILRRSGGVEFLKRASSPTTSKRALQGEILNYFPAEDQEAAYSAWIKELIDRARAEGLSGDKLITRVGEMHNAGPSGRSLKYGKRAGDEYKRSLPKVEEKCNQQGTCTGKFIDPAPGYPLTSLFGWRPHPITGGRRFHSGIDIGVPLGAPIKAADGGTITHSGDMGGYGFTIDINHCDIRSTRYAHNSQLLVGRGTGVKQGQVISKAGSTGNSTGPHLHFEVRIKGNAVNPLTYLKGR